jgi:carbon-monoxide dehydrogenase large subunit
VIGAIAALELGAPLAWPRRRGNIVCDVTLGDAMATTRAFAGAAKVVTLTLINQRVVANYLDTRGVVAEYEDKHGRFTVTLSSQGPHAIRDVLTEILHVSAETAGGVRIIPASAGLRELRTHGCKDCGVWVTDANDPWTTST